MQVVVGSLNTVKVKAVRDYLSTRFSSLRVWGIDVPSGVSEQPLGDEETRRGAVQRAEAALAAAAADLAIGLEAGAVKGPGGLFLCTWAAALDRQGRLGTGSSMRILLPLHIAQQVAAGIPLAGAIREQAAAIRDAAEEEGAVSLLTAGGLTRGTVCYQAVMAALAPLLQAALYNGEKG